MARKEKVDIIRQAVKQLIEDDTHSDSGENRHTQILNTLLSQLDSIQVDEERSPEESETRETPEIEEKVDNKAVLKDEEVILKELKEVKRQNFITHCLMSAMIVLTLVWQVSEISVALKIRGALCNPVKSLGGWFTGRREMNIQDAIKSMNHKQLIENTSIPGLLPGLDSSDDGDDK